MVKLQNKIKLHFKLPTHHNDHTPIPDKEFVGVRNYFVNLYGGLTVDSPSYGFWEDDGVVYEDEILEYSIFIPKRDFERNYKNRISYQIETFKKQFKQIDILCYYYGVVSN